VAVPDRVVVTLPQDCQPPVLLIATLAMMGPVVESSRYWTVPVAVDPLALLVVTVVAVVAPKSTPEYARKSPGAMKPTFWPPPVSVVVSTWVPDCELKLSAWVTAYASRLGCGP
jgi:hypothetical protein